MNLAKVDDELVATGKQLGRVCEVSGCLSEQDPLENIQAVWGHALCDGHVLQWQREMESAERIRGRLERWLAHVNGARQVKR